MTLRISAPARLHLGLIDLRGDLGRRFGSLGVALAAPRLVLTARAATLRPGRGRVWRWKQRSPPTSVWARAPKSPWLPGRYWPGCAPSPSPQQR